MGRELLPSDWSIDLATGDLSFIRIDHQVRLQFGDVEVVIETPFELRQGDACASLDPEDRGGLGPLLALYPTVLASSTVDFNGTLRLSFDCGASISVAPHPVYEAWQINGP